MKQLVIALLVKLDKKYPDKGISKLMSEFDKDWEKSKKWVSKSGALDHSVEELFDRLTVDAREEVFTKLFMKLYPTAGISKHPKKRVWLFKMGENKFFYEVVNNSVVMPMGIDEPRVFTAGRFIENMPKLEEFIKYLGSYSMRNRRRFRM